MNMSNEHSADFDSSDDIPLADLRITPSQSYTTPENTTVSIDDGKLRNSSSGTFHSKYRVVTDLCETDSSVLWVGETRGCGTEVVVKRAQFDDKDDLDGLLKEDGTPIEVACQKRAEDVEVEGGMGTVLKVLDWYVYDDYFVAITEYDPKLITLYNHTNCQEDECLGEEESKNIYLLLSKLVLEMNRAGVYHLDLKPSNVLYDPDSKRIKLLDFGHSDSVDAGENPVIRHTCGTDGMITPQQVEKTECRGREVDEWGVAQVIFYCLQGSHTFDTDEDIVEKEVEFKKEVSEKCKSFLLGLLTKDADDRLTFKDSFQHPWLEERD